MIIYSPLDGIPIPHEVQSQPKHCFLMTRLGKASPEEGNKDSQEMVDDIRKAIEISCKIRSYEVIDAQARVTGRDFLLKIWKLIAASPLAVAILHEGMPESTKANIYYEFGVAQALGKETLIVKSPTYKIPSDFVRSEYINYNDDFRVSFEAYLDSIYEQADYYELMSDQLEKNPILALDYLKRAYLITGKSSLKVKAQDIIKATGLDERAANSVELLAASFSKA